MDIRALQTALTSLQYSKRRISEYDYSFGHYQPENHAEYEKTRRESLAPIEEAIKAIRIEIQRRKHEISD
jgi:hypothetical protein